MASPSKEWIMPAMPIFATPKRTARDHPYAARKPVSPRTPPVSLASALLKRGRGRPPKRARFESTSESSITPTSTPGKTPQKVTSSEYEPDSETTSTSSDETEQRSAAAILCDVPKYLVFESELDLLFKTCRQSGCSKPVIGTQRNTVGTMVKYVTTCLDGHICMWKSQPQIRNRPAGNVAVASGLALTGNTYTKMEAFAKCIGMQFVSKTVVNEIQNFAVFPVIQESWIEERDRLKVQIGDERLVLAGDGRCDSPGHCAKYGCYTFMICDNGNPELEGKIIECQLTDIAQESIKNSHALETVGFTRGMDAMLEDGIGIETVATDRHITIASIMRKQYDQIKHQYDVWHVVKSVQKKLTQACRTTGGQPLQAWRQSVTNHLWWCVSTCDGNEQLLREKWFSILQHIQGKHRWSGSQLFHRCEHGKLSKKDRKDILWLRVGTEAFQALQDIVTDKNLIKAFPQMTDFCHTGSLEVFHQSLLKYLPKRLHFPHAGMKARYFMAALEWNAQDHTARTPRTKDDIEVVYSKRHGEYVVRALPGRNRKEVATDLRKKLLTKMMDVHLTQRQMEPMKIPDDLHERISKRDKPSKEAMFSTYRSRLAKKATS